MKDVVCPNCKQHVTEASKFFPFCSERCKLIDLGQWAAEKYSIAGKGESQQSGDAEEE